MARRIGADMLANLDRQLAAGAISQAQHEARKAEVLEMIRTGKDIDMGVREKLVRVIAGIVIAIAGIVGGATIISVGGFILAAWAFIIAGCVVGYKVAHPRAK